MNIVLQKVISYSEKCLESRALLRSVIEDMYPAEIQEKNVLLDIYESGIPKKLKESGEINEIKFEEYVHIVVKNYGIQRSLVVDGLNEWIKVILGENHIIETQEVNEPDESSEDTSDPEEFIIEKEKNCAYIKKYVGTHKKTVYIPKQVNNIEVKGVGKAAFKGNRTIEKVVLPEGIEHIADDAFAECISLKQVIFPSTLKKIGSESFSSTSVKVRASGAFAHTALEEVTVPDNVEYIGYSAFRDCFNLKKIMLPEELKKICEMAFNGCKSLKEVAFPSNTKTVEKNAFAGCHEMKRVELNKGLETIESKAFAGCDMLGEIAIPDSVNFIDSNAFTKSTNFFKPVVFICEAGTQAEEYAKANLIEIKEPEEMIPVDLPKEESSTEIEKEPEPEQMSDTDIVVPESWLETAKEEQEPEKEQEPEEEQEPEKEQEPEENQDLEENTDEIEVQDFRIKLLEDGAEIKGYLGEKNELTVLASINEFQVKGIASDAFRANKALTSVIIEEGIEYIENGAFADCSALKEVSLPKSLKKMGSENYCDIGVFSHSAIENICLPSLLMSVGFKMFWGCKCLRKVSFPENLQKICGFAFSNCRALEEVELPDSVEEIEACAFYGCSEIKKLKLSTSLKKIGVSAFEGCKAYDSDPKKL